MFCCVALLLLFITHLNLAILEKNDLANKHLHMIIIFFFSGTNFIMAVISIYLVVCVCVKWNTGNTVKFNLFIPWRPYDDDDDELFHDEGHIISSTMLTMVMIATIVFIIIRGGYFFYCYMWLVLLVFYYYYYEIVFFLVLSFLWSLLLWKNSQDNHETKRKKPSWLIII